MKEYTGSQYSSQRLSRACLDRWPFCPAASTRLQRVVAKCPAGRTRALSSISICLTGDPLPQERIDDGVAVAVARDEVVANERGERRLDGRRAAEAVACPNVARQELAAILRDGGAQHGGAHGVLHGAAVEPGDRLKLVERDDDLSMARLGETRRQREHLLREPGDIPLCPDRGKGDGQITERRVAGRISDLGACGTDRL